jgi:uncharacterized protein with NRDE domain
VDSARSRGSLVRDFLASGISAPEYADDVMGLSDRFNGFNLLLWDGREFAYASNRWHAGRKRVEPGIHGLSNADLDTEWPKVRSGKRELTNALENGSVDSGSLLRILQDDVRAPEEELPDTGVGREKERMLSSRFIRSEDYGTRSSTVILIERGGRIQFTEQTHIPADTRPSIVEFELIPT